jgi:hypothetical protein
MKVYDNIFTKNECDFIINVIKESYKLEDFLIYNPEKKINIIQPEHAQRKGINFFDIIEKKQNKLI